ncbi:protein NCBP2AS2 homolog [Uranotaenia lowii]|uniref:protein NCBP2AS2 homolog n=1 Tax=Uranotaenia lowii TaxID=190385 RepID=UPI00247A6CF1|nr:protein NCBP2AS2 homolog [Uranotaenia lowii]
MVLRMLFRYLANNEQLIQRLADSYPMRRAAQLLVGVYFRTQSIAAQNKLLSSEQFVRMVRSLKSNIKEKLEPANQDMKKKK